VRLQSLLADNEPGAIWFALGVLRKRRLRVSDLIRSEAGYVRRILDAVLSGYSDYDDWSAFSGEA
jgi:hypothetical protein